MSFLLNLLHKKYIFQKENMSIQIDCMQDMCRTCMIQFSKTKKKNVKKRSIHEMPSGCKMNKSIMELLQLVQPQIKIEVNDNLPALICSDCVQKLLVSHGFLETFRSVDIKLRKMLREIEEISDCSYNFIEIDDKSLETIQENNNAEMSDKEKEIVEIAKCEFEIKEINIEGFEKKVEDEDEWPEFVNESLEELSEESECKDSNFLNSYSDASDNEWTPPQSCQKTSPKKTVAQKRNTEYKINDATINSTSTKISSRKISKSKKEDEAEISLRMQNITGSASCHQCDTGFDDIKLLEEHMAQHRLEKIPKYTKKSDNLRKHETNQRNFKCEQCGKGFTKKYSYRYHMQMHSDESYLCIECGKSFKKINSLNIHMLRHKGEKTFQCELCPKKFVCSSGLYGHMMVHTKEKSYVCAICGSAFHMACQLRKHNRYHDGIKNYQCEYCDMRFVTREKQLRHMRTHTGEKPYSCKYCERAFAQSNDCVKHLRQHLGDNVYQCDLCPLRFPMARDLRAHFATHKDDDEETRARNLEARKEEEQNLQIKFGSKKTCEQPIP